jgi:hypothetical protein
MNLTDVLSRSTDEIAAPGLEAATLTAARERTARRRTVGASVAAVVAVVATVTVGSLVGGDGESLPAPPVSSRTDASSVAADEAIGPTWDPRSVVDAPPHASVLSSELAPPDLPPNIQDDPMDVAVLAWPEAGADLKLLGIDGRWRCIGDTADLADETAYPGWSGVAQPALSDDGTRVAMPGNDGILVVDVRTGEQETITWPGQLAPPRDSPPLVEWLNDDHLVVREYPRAWVVGLDEAARPAPFGRPYEFAVDRDDGSVVEKRYDLNDILRWRGNDVVGSAPVAYWGERLAAGHGLLAFTGGGGGLPADGGPIVVDVASGELVAYRPVRDPNAYYSDNGHLTAVGFLDADTVLYLVGPPARPATGGHRWHLVAWDLRTGEFRRLASGPEGMRSSDVAIGVLANE